MTKEDLIAHAKHESISVLFWCIQNRINFSTDKDKLAEDYYVEYKKDMVNGITKLYNRLLNSKLYGQ